MRTSDRFLCPDLRVSRASTGRPNVHHNAQLLAYRRPPSVDIGIVTTHAPLPVVLAYAHTGACNRKELAK